MTLGEGRPEGYEGYEEVHATAAVEIRPPGGLLAVRGRDAVSFLHGVLTNDVAALAPGQGCYAASLTAQGRMVGDMFVLRRDADVLLVVEPHVAAGLAARFDQSIFTEDAAVDDRSASVTSIGVHGPAALVAIAAAIGEGRADIVRTALARDRHVSVAGTSGEVIVFGAEWLGVRGVRVVGPEADVAELRARLRGAGLPELGPEALTARRIEAGTPVFGVDMTTETIPLEAGIASRAVSMTKGCYVGQEIIVRILHRGHGRVARRLTGVVGATSSLVQGASLFADGKEAGAVTSAAWSQALGSRAALAVIHREALEAGTPLAVGGPSGPPATVRELPLVTH